MNFFDRFSRNPQILNFIKIPLGGADLFHAERQTDGQRDITKLIVAFRNLKNMPKTYATNREVGTIGHALYVLLTFRG